MSQKQHNNIPNFEELNPEHIAQTEPPEEFFSTDEFVSFENPGDSVIGSLIGYSPVENWQPGTGKVQGFFHMLTDTALVRFSHTKALDKLRRYPAGIRLRIEFREEVKVDGGRRFKRFSIQLSTRNLSKEGVEFLLTEIEQNKHHLPLLEPIREENIPDTEEDPYSDETSING